MSALETIFTPIQEIGTPSRKPVENVNDFIAKGIKYQADSPIHANLHENRIVPISKYKKEYIPLSLENIYFDFDVPSDFKGGDIEGITLVEKNMRIAVDRLYQRGITDKDIVKVWTTKKGSHLHVRIKKIEGLENPDFAVEVKRKIIGFQRVITKGLITADPKVFGDFSRVARVPGFSRTETGLMPCVVDHTTHLLKFMKTMSTWTKLEEYGVDKLYSWGNGIQPLDDLVKPEDYAGIIVNKRKLMDTSKLGSYGIKRLNKQVDEAGKAQLLTYFKQYMPDKVAEQFVDFDPPYNYRLVGARCLFEAGISIDRICNLIASIGWSNFDWDVTYDILENVRTWNSV